jgi:hypothetical protein
MKRSQLQALIREALNEVLNETTFDVPNPGQLTASQKQTMINQAKARTRNNKIGTPDSPAEFIEEEELNEMAWGIAGNRLQYYKKTSLEKEVEIPQRLTPQQQNIINVLRQNEGGIVSDKEIQDTLGLSRPQMVNSQLSNIFTQAPAAPAAIQPRGPEGEEGPEDDGEDELPSGYEDPEGGVAGDMSDEEIEASFARMRTGGDDEENIEDIEVDAAVSPSKGMSDDEFQAWMAYQELERRLANVKSNILKARKSRPTPGDIQDRPSNEVENLRDLKKRLEDKMMAIVSKFPTVSKDYKAPEIEMPEEEPLDEWTMNKMKYYAGILK